MEILAKLIALGMVLGSILGWQYMNTHKDNSNNDYSQIVNCQINSTLYYDMECVDGIVMP